MPEIFTITKETEAVKHLSGADARLGEIFELVGELTYSLYPDPYTFMIETIVGQMLSNKVADVLAERLRAACSGEISPPAVARLAVPDLRSCGLSNSKATSILGLTDLVTRNELDFAAINGLAEAEIVAELTKMRGIGNWSAKMYLIFVLGKEDVLPYEDGAFLQAYAWLYQTDQLKKKEVEANCEKWKPYSTTAARYLYRALDLGLTKIPR